MGDVLHQDNFLPKQGNVKVAKVALADLDAGGGVFAWPNPHEEAIAVTKVELDLQTKSTAASTIDVGTTTVGATTSSDNLMDGLDTGTAAGLFNNTDDKGTNGKSHQRLASGKWVTGSKASGACAGLKGFVYIHYIILSAV